MSRPKGNALPPQGSRGQRYQIYVHEGYMLREDIELEHFVITVIFDLKILEKEEEDRAEEHFQAGFMSEMSGVRGH